MEPKVFVNYLPEYPVRIIFREAYVAQDLVVQRMIDNEWVDEVSYNEMSDDYAFTNARQSAKEVCRRIDNEVEGY